MTTVPLAPGEQWGQRWEFNTLVERRDIDYARATVPNVGGVTEMLKIMAMCETHRVGIVPHFTGPVSTAAHVHFLTSFSGQVVMEYNYGTTQPGTGNLSHLTAFVDFREGKCWPNDRPGLGVSLDMKQLTQAGEYSTPLAATPIDVAMALRLTGSASLGLSSPDGGGIPRVTERTL